MEGWLSGSMPGLGQQIDQGFGRFKETTEGIGGIEQHVRVTALIRKLLELGDHVVSTYVTGGDM